MACDYVINDWLLEMQVGAPPTHGLLHDPQLKGSSAEEVYDRIVGDIGRIRKLLTLAGRQPDMLDRKLSPHKGDFTDLDDFYKTQLGKGLLLHAGQRSTGRAGGILRCHGRRRGLFAGRRHRWSGTNQGVRRHRVAARIDKLLAAIDFPNNGPILVITDGGGESKLDCARPHAFFLPAGKRLPFATRSEVFYLR